MSSSDATIPFCTNLPNCTPCFFGGATKTLEYPYNITSSIEITIIPYITQLPDGTNSTISLETLSTTEFVSNDGDQFLTDEVPTWVTDGVTLTAPTLYASFGNFSGVGAAATPFDNVTATCATLISTKSITIPATADPASFILAPASGTDFPELEPDILPSELLVYLDSLSTVRQQLNGNGVTTCSPTTVNTSPTVCLTVTTTSSEDCTTFNPSSSSCTTAVSSGTVTKTIIATVGPPPSPPVDIKTPAVALQRRTGDAVFRPYTPPVEGPVTPPPSQESPPPVVPPPAESQVIPPSNPDTNPPPNQENPPPADDTDDVPAPVIPPESQVPPPDNSQDDPQPVIPPENNPPEPGIVPPPAGDTPNPNAPAPTDMGDYIISGISPSQEPSVVTFVTESLATNVGPSGKSIATIPITAESTIGVAPESTITFVGADGQTSVSIIPGSTANPSISVIPEYTTTFVGSDGVTSTSVVPESTISAPVQYTGSVSRKSAGSMTMLLAGVLSALAVVVM